MIQSNNPNLSKSKKDLINSSIQSPNFKPVLKPHIQTLQNPFNKIPISQSPSYKTPKSPKPTSTPTLKHPISPDPTHQQSSDFSTTSENSSSEKSQLYRRRQTPNSHKTQTQRINQSPPQKSAIKKLNRVHKTQKNRTQMHMLTNTDTSTIETETELLGIRSIFCISLMMGLRFLVFWSCDFDEYHFCSLPFPLLSPPSSLAIYQRKGTL